MISIVSSETDSHICPIILSLSRLICCDFLMISHIVSLISTEVSSTGEYIFIKSLTVFRHSSVSSGDRMTFLMIRSSLNFKYPRKILSAEH